MNNQQKTKSIYKITNKTNGKIYVGQSNNPKRRFQEHSNLGYGDNQNITSLLYKAIEKYGIKNFEFEIIENDVTNYNEREKYWIEKLNSLAPSGYNLTIGGEEPPIHSGLDSTFTTHTLDIVKKIKELLKTTDLSTAEIGKITNYDRSAILRINKGEIWYDENENYPIRPEGLQSYANERALLIIEDLKNSALTQKEIAEKYGLGRTAITAINLGKNCRQDNLEYPIRKTSVRTDIKPVLMLDKNTLEIIKEFSNLCEASKFLNKDRGQGGIRKACLDSNKTAYGYKWKYKDN